MTEEKLEPKAVGLVHLLLVELGIGVENDDGGVLQVLELWLAFFEIFVGLSQDLRFYFTLS